MKKTEEWRYLFEEYENREIEPEYEFDDEAALDKELESLMNRA